VTATQIILLGRSSWLVTWLHRSFTVWSVYEMCPYGLYWWV